MLNGRESARILDNPSTAGHAGCTMSGLSRVRLAEIIDRSIIPRQPVLSRNHNRIKRNERMKEERRLVWRVLRHGNEITDGGRFRAVTKPIPGCSAKTGLIVV
jgi:hypothetical protein